MFASRKPNGAGSDVHQAERTAPRIPSLMSPIRRSRLLRGARPLPEINMAKRIRKLAKRGGRLRLAAHALMFGILLVLTDNIYVSSSGLQRFKWLVRCRTGRKSPGPIGSLGTPPRVVVSPTFSVARLLIPDTLDD